MKKLTLRGLAWWLVTIVNIALKIFESRNCGCGHQFDEIDEKHYKFLVFFQRSSAVSQESFFISREVVNLSHNTKKSRLPCRLFRACTVCGLGRRCSARHWNLQLLKKFESKTRVGYCSRCVF